MTANLIFRETDKMTDQPPISARISFAGAATGAVLFVICLLLSLFLPAFELTMGRIALFCGVLGALVGIVAGFAAGAAGRKGLITGAVLGLAVIVLLIYSTGHPVETAPAQTGSMAPKARVATT